MNTGLALATFIDGPFAIVGGFGAVAAGAFGTYSILESQEKPPIAIGKIKIALFRQYKFPRIFEKYTS